MSLYGEVTLADFAITLSPINSQGINKYSETDLKKKAVIWSFFTKHTV